MKLLIINETCGTGSHGRICADIAQKYEKNGHEVRYAYGRNQQVSADCRKYAIRIGSNLDVYLHWILTRLLDLHGFGSKRATKRFLKWADRFEPDVIWIHNLHGYYINIELLFSWIKSRKEIHVKWTLHDCWAFTGHCGHFTAAGCSRWKRQCVDCPEKRSYPKSIFKDNSYCNYIRKRKAFTGVKHMELITPSDWLARLVRESFLNVYPITVKNNTVNKKVFKPVHSEFKKRYGIKNKTMVLGVSNVWNSRKGLDDFKKLSKLLDDTYVIVLAGIKKHQLIGMAGNVIGIPRVENPGKLAEIYSAADIFVNPSVEETFGMTSLEAASCGTFVIVYKGTACEEIAKTYGGKAVSKGAWNIYREILRYRKGKNN